MKTITPEQAQQLANILGMFITADKDGSVGLYTSQPYWTPSFHLGVWVGCQPMQLNIRIASSRPWTEQIWRPEV